MTNLTASGPGAPSLDLEYCYSENLQNCNEVGTQNNGQIRRMKDLISGEEVTYQYDALSRVISTGTTDSAWGLSFTYDGFGNKTQQTVTKGSGPNFSAAVDGLTNRFVGAGYSYDANGNLTSMGTYDVANRLQGSGHVYGPRNERIMKGGSGEVNFYSPDGRRMGAYQMIVSYGVIGFNQIRTNVYFAGKRIREANEAVVLDRLGSVRGSQVMNYYPYGEERTTTANNFTKFGTYFRDEPGLDYADQRYYSNVQGRFLTPDPFEGSAGLENPASWHRYGYVMGDPVNLTDPTGLIAENDPCGEDWPTDPSLSGPCAAHGAGSQSITRRVYDAFDPLKGFITSWEYANKWGTRFTIYLTDDAYEVLKSSGLLTAPAQAIKALPGWWKLVGIGILAVETIRDWWESREAKAREAKRQENCYSQYEADVKECQRRGTGRACYDSAAQRLGNCLAGRPLGPLSP